MESGFKLYKNVLSVENLNIKFKQTPKLPNGAEDITPPPSKKENLPIKRVQDYKDILPEHWEKSLGVFIPASKNQGLSIQFSVDKPDINIYAVKIGIGKVNIITGKDLKETMNEKEQDYIVVPDQNYVHGVLSGTYISGQFVTVPCNLGYSIESQKNGFEVIKGLQFIVYKKSPIGVLDKKYNFDCFKGVFQVFIRTLSGRILTILCSKSDPVGKLKRQISELIKCPNNDLLRLVCGTQQLEEGTLSMYDNIRENCTIDIVLRLKGGMKRKRIQKSKEMTIGLGENLCSKYLEDYRKVNYWNEENPFKLFVRFLNSNSWKYVTDENPPLQKCYTGEKNEEFISTDCNYKEVEKYYKPLENEYSFNGIKKVDLIKKRRKEKKKLGIKNGEW